MVIAEIVTLLLYAVSIVFLPEYFGAFFCSISSQVATSEYRTSLSPDLAFVVSVRFAWKVALIVLVSTFPLYVIKFIRSKISPAASSKLL